nr:PREDICTED: uncharacterized protein LOC105272904 [Fopius arisanus]
MSYVNFSEKIVCPSEWVSLVEAEKLEDAIHAVIGSHVLNLRKKVPPFVFLEFEIKGTLVETQGTFVFLKDAEFQTWYESSDRWRDFAEANVGLDADEEPDVLFYMTADGELADSDVPGYIEFRENVFIPRTWFEHMPNDGAIREHIVGAVGLQVLDPRKRVCLQRCAASPELILTHMRRGYWFVPREDRQRTIRDYAGYGRMVYRV